MNAVAVILKKIAVNGLAQSAVLARHDLSLATFSRDAVLGRVNEQQFFMPAVIHRWALWQEMVREIGIHQPPNEHARNFQKLIYSIPLLAAVAYVMSGGHRITSDHVHIVVAGIGLLEEDALHVTNAMEVFGPFSGVRLPIRWTFVGYDVKKESRRQVSEQVSVEISKGSLGKCLARINQPPRLVLLASPGFTAHWQEWLAPRELEQVFKRRLPCWATAHGLADMLECVGFWRAWGGVADRCWASHFWNSLTEPIRPWSWFYELTGECPKPTVRLSRLNNSVLEGEQRVRDLSLDLYEASSVPSGDILADGRLTIGPTLALSDRGALTLRTRCSCVLAVAPQRITRKLFDCRNAYLRYVLLRELLSSPGFVTDEAGQVLRHGLMNTSARRQVPARADMNRHRPRRGSKG